MSRGPLSPECPQLLLDFTNPSSPNRFDVSGTHRCSACGQLCKVYKRKLNRPMAHLLLWMFRHHPEEWVDIPRVGPMIQGRRGGGDFAKLRFWGLIEQKENIDPRKRCSGIWRITPAGRLFASGGGTVPERVYIMNGKFLGFGEKDISIHKALGTDFDYREI